MDIIIIIATALTVLAAMAAALLVVRPTSGRTAIARVFAKIALTGAVAIFALLSR
jgi:hypothetical protein